MPSLAGWHFFESYHNIHFKISINYLLFNKPLDNFEKIRVIKFMAEKPVQFNSNISLQLDLLNFDLNEIKNYINQLKALPDAVYPESSKNFLLCDLDRLCSDIEEKINNIQNALNSDLPIDNIKTDDAE